MFGDNRAANLTSANRYAQKLVDLAQRERARKGARENQGYDSQNKLQDYLEKLPDLTYRDKCNIIAEFYKGCKSIT